MYYALHSLADHEDVLIFEIIMKLLYPRGHANRSEIFMKGFEVCLFLMLEYFLCLSVYSDNIIHSIRMPTINSVCNVILSYCFRVAM